MAPGTKVQPGKDCDFWLPGKGPQWQHFGFQVAQKGGKPDQAAGQLITDPSGKYVLARNSAPIPYANCGPGTCTYHLRNKSEL